MSGPPRVAFFTDSFHEVNGVAHASRHFNAFARRRGLPFLSVHAGRETRVVDEGPVRTYELQRSGVGFHLEHDMSFDLLFLRHRERLAEELRRFGADLIHITGPSDVGMLGALLAHRLHLPLVASWHTNVHEFGARRLAKMMSFLPPRLLQRVAAFAEQDIILALSLRYYQLARVLLAPNLELVSLLQRRTRRPAFLMQRGVDTALFSPEKRRRCDDPIVIGYVGRLSPEKSVRVLRDVEQALISAGVENFRIMVVGDGHERAWLEANLRHVECTGILTGEDLAAAYAGMDVFAFPSLTDTFGNVILEAMASGVPPVVTSGGGPKYLVTHGVSGLVAEDTRAFCENVVALAKDPDLRRRMSVRARDFALCRYWNRIFDGVYEAYEYCLRASRPASVRPSQAAAAGRSFA